ncbi:hypothetical protein SOVF_107180, partial [Spinacia oleracea]
MKFQSPHKMVLTQGSIRQQMTTRRLETISRSAISQS